MLREVIEAEWNARQRVNPCDCDHHDPTKCRCEANCTCHQITERKEPYPLVARLHLPPDCW